MCVLYQHRKRRNQKTSSYAQLRNSIVPFKVEWMNQTSERGEGKSLFFSAKFKRRESETSETFDIMIRLKKDFISISLGKKFNWIQMSLRKIDVPFDNFPTVWSHQFTLTLEASSSFSHHQPLRDIFRSFVSHVLQIQVVIFLQSQSKLSEHTDKSNS